MHSGEIQVWGLASVSASSVEFKLDDIHEFPSSSAKEATDV